MSVGCTFGGNKGSWLLAGTTFRLDTFCKTTFVLSPQPKYET